MIEVLPNFHPLLVHFTIALLFVSFFAFLVSLSGSNYTVRYQARILGRWNLWIGAALTILTVGAGIYAYFTVAHDGPSHIVMDMHRNLALGTLALYIILAIWSLMHFRNDRDESKGFVFTMFLAVVLMVVTAWYGGELVYRHGLGVKSLPAAEGPGHQHAHGDEHEHDNAMDKGEMDGKESHEHGHNEAEAGHTHKDDHTH